MKMKPAVGQYGKVSYAPTEVQKINSRRLEVTLSHLSMQDDSFMEVLIAQNP